MFSLFRFCFLFLLVNLPLIVHAGAPDPLPSWRNGDARRTILEFVARTTDPASPFFVPVMERVAVFDHDGTLWPTHPVPVQMRFAVDRVLAQVGDHPEWYRREPYKTVLEQDEARIASLGERELMQMMLATSNGMSSEEFQAAVRQWLGTARHPRFDRPYTELVYQPMRELISLLESNGYRCFIFATGGVEFLRSYVETVYGLPAERVIGNQVKTEYQLQNGKPVLLRLPLVHLSDERTGKVATLNHYLGRRPVLIAGDTHTDEPMLGWTASGPGSRLVLRIRHDDAVREYSSEQAEGSGKETGGEAPINRRGGQMVSIKDDWNQIFAGDALKAAAAP